jgi:hypothetical protein
VTLGCAAHGADAHCAWGLVSRSGWALVNESGAPVLDAEEWWTPDGPASRHLLRSRSEHDLYLFAHGLDLRAALRDFSLVAGRAPLPARRQLGVILSRWYNYDSADLRQLPLEVAREGVPLDVLTLDMNWHTKYDWTGYSWDRQLLPFPSDALGWLRARGISVGANLHDASGVLRSEERFAAFCAQMGVDPQRPPAPEGMPLDLLNRSYLRALDDELLLPLEREGVDFW